MVGEQGEMVMFGQFTKESLDQFLNDYGERLIRMPSGLYEIKKQGDKVTLVPEGSEPKTGAELAPGAKNRNISGKRMTDAGAKGRVKGAQAAVNKAPNPGAKTAAMKNLNAAQIG